MPQMNLAEALIDGLLWSLRSDPRATIIGRGIAGHGPEHVAENRLKKEFANRIVDPPTSEAAVAQLGTGAAMAGARPFVHYGTAVFAYEAWNQFINEAANVHYMSNGQLKAPVTFHLFHGIRGGGGPQHSGSPQAMYANNPGLEIVMPASPRDAKGLIRSAMASDNPTIVIQHALLLSLTEDVPAEDYAIPLGQAAVKRSGRDVSIVACSRSVVDALEAAAILEREGISVEVVDIRTIAPLDVKTIVSSVEKTGRLVAVDESYEICGVASELIATVTTRAFASLKSQPVRVARPMVPVPFSPPLEAAVTPGVDRIVEACRLACGR
jgi:acetoin:2,6-dichlorophenolindophenol oxidoreductase subunit beta